MGNGARKPRPQATHPSAWRVGNKLISKVEQKQTLLVEKKPCVSWKNQAKVNIFSSSAGANGTFSTNRPMPLWPFPSLTTQTKPILRPRLLSV